MNHIIDFFKKIGHFLGAAFHLLHLVFSEQQLEQAVLLVKTAADKYTDNQQRREWVAMELVSVCHLPESVARLLTELAVNLVKHEEGVLLDKLAAAAKQG